MNTLRTYILRLVAVAVFMVAMTVPTVDARDFIVVIDPGHGGKDAGALGDKTNEKTINLAVGLKLRKLLNKEMKDVKVVMTRDDDRFVTLQGRCDIANKAKADLFISIHANSIDKKSPKRKTINGAAVYTLGLSRSNANLEVAMRENGVMKLESDYSTTYQGFDPSSAESYIMFEMMQHNNLDQSINLAQAVQNEFVSTAGRRNLGVKQAPFWVLVKTGMPAILVELDFICNPTQEKFMASASGQDKLARSIFNGIKKYRGSNGKTTITAQSPVVTGVDSDESDDSEAEPAPAPDTAGKIVYKVQFLTSDSELRRGDKRLKGLSPVESYRDGGLVKYTHGSTTSMAEAQRILKKVKKSFPQAFIIKTRDGKRIK